MTLSLHYHPLSSCCWKALIALYEMDIPFEPRLLNFGDPAERERFVAKWPTGKIPLLEDDGAVVAETSIIIEHLSRRHSTAQRSMLPAAADDGLEVRLMDRLLDLYVMTPMQAIVADRIRAESDRDATGVAKAKSTLEMAYGLLEGKLEGRTWMAGERFSMADCAAAPSLFYATTLVPLRDAQPRLRSYLERVLEKPSVARVLEEARPVFRFYPYREALPKRYFDPAGE